MTNDTVFVATLTGGRRSKRYHTDPECRYLNDARNAHTVSRETLPDGTEECRWCQGERAFTPDGGSRAHLESLKAAAEERA